MFKSVDLLIGFTVVMLVVSMVVTMITQAVVNATNLRGAALKAGITQLLVLIDRGIDAGAAAKIADHILRDPLISPFGLWGHRWLTPVVQREELTKLLLEFASLPPPAPAPANAKLAEVANLQATLRDSLSRNGIPTPQATLSMIRRAALELEKTNPELSNTARANIAILNFAASDFVGKLNGWFDQTIDRSSQVFTGWARVITVFGAVVVACVLQIDSVKIINQLWTNDAVRADLVTWATKNPALFDPNPHTDVANTPATHNPPTPAAGADGHSTDLAASAKVVPPAPAPQTGPAKNADPSSPPPLGATVKKLLATDLVSIPATYDEWSENWPKAWAGVFLSAILLSLGAPFWYAVLKNLLKLRSDLAGKDDAQRTERQTTQPPAPQPTPPQPLALVQGEMGDLKAVG